MNLWSWQALAPSTLHPGMCAPVLCAAQDKALLEWLDDSVLLLRKGHASCIASHMALPLLRHLHAQLRAAVTLTGEWCGADTQVPAPATPRPALHVPWLKAHADHVQQLGLPAQFCKHTPLQTLTRILACS